MYSYNFKENRWLCDKRKITKPSPRSGFAMWIWEGVLDLDEDDEDEDIEEVDFDDEEEGDFEEADDEGII